MRRVWGAAVAGMFLFGCSTVELAQRNGCWVRHSKSFLNNQKEEIGVCSRTPPQWSQDRVTRLAQECMVEADYRWQNLALDAWNRGQPLPPERPEHEVMQQCMNDAATSLVAENQRLEKQLAELTKQRDGAVAQAAQDHQDLRQSQTQMTEALGEAAKRPTPNAYALATSSGTADTKTDAQPPATPVVVPTTVVPLQVNPPGVASAAVPANGAPPVRITVAPPGNAAQPGNGASPVQVAVVPTGPGGNGAAPGNAAPQVQATHAPGQPLGPGAGTPAESSQRKGTATGVGGSGCAPAQKAARHHAALPACPPAGPALKDTTAQRAIPLSPTAAPATSPAVK